MKRATTAFANALKIPQLCSVRFEDIQAPLGFQLNEDQQVLKNAISVKSTWTQSSIASGSKVSFTRLDLCVQGKIPQNDMTDGGQAFQTICGSTMPSSNDPDSFISDYNAAKQLEVWGTRAGIIYVCSRKHLHTYIRVDICVYICVYTCNV